MITDSFLISAQLTCYLVLVKEVGVYDFILRG